MNEPIKTFNEIWEEAEKIAHKIYDKNTNRADWNQEIDRAIKTLQEMKSIPQEYNGVMYRKMGELLFILTQISYLTNINTYLALQDEMKYRELEFT